MAATRTRKATNKRTRENAMQACIAHALTLSKTAHIARAFGFNPKSARAVVRAGALKDGNGERLAPVYVSNDGDAALSDAHKSALIVRYAPQADDALFALADTVAPGWDK